MTQDVQKNYILIEVRDEHPDYFRTDTMRLRKAIHDLITENDFNAATLVFNDPNRKRRVLKVSRDYWPLMASVFSAVMRRFKNLTYN